MITRWSIEQLERNSVNGGVTTAHWRVVATEGEYSASVYGSMGFTPDPKAPNFKPFYSLSEADVLGWVWRNLNKNETEISLAQQLNSQKNPVSVTGTPWQTAG